MLRCLQRLWFIFRTEKPLYSKRFTLYSLYMCAYIVFFCCLYWSPLNGIPNPCVPVCLSFALVSDFVMFLPNISFMRKQIPLAQPLPYGCMHTQSSELYAIAPSNHYNVESEQRGERSSFSITHLPKLIEFR